MKAYKYSITLVGDGRAVGIVLAKNEEQAKELLNEDYSEYKDYNPFHIDLEELPKLGKSKVIELYTT